jgi:hypothetical protein
VLFCIDRLLPDSFFRPYYDMLPPTLSNMPVVWDAAKLQWLCGSHMLVQVRIFICFLFSFYRAAAVVLRLINSSVYGLFGMGGTVAPNSVGILNTNGFTLGAYQSVRARRVAMVVLLMALVQASSGCHRLTHVTQCPRHGGAVIARVLESSTPSQHSAGILQFNITIASCQGMRTACID